MAGCVVLTTVAAAADAEALARSIVAARLAACVQVVGPIRSIYRWHGEVCAEQEWRCEAKTTTERVDALVEHIAANHPYELPEIVTLPIVAGSRPYLDWLATETTG